MLGAFTNTLVVHGLQQHILDIFSCSPSRVVELVSYTALF